MKSCPNPSSDVAGRGELPGCGNGICHWKNPAPSPWGTNWTTAWPSAPAAGPSTNPEICHRRGRRHLDDSRASDYLNPPERGYGEKVSRELPKLKLRVRFPLPAPRKAPRSGRFFVSPLSGCALAKVLAKHSCKSSSIAHFLGSRLESRGRGSAIFRCSTRTLIDQITSAHPNFALSFADVTSRNFTSSLRGKAEASRDTKHCNIYIIQEKCRKKLIRQTLVTPP